MLIPSRVDVGDESACWSSEGVGGGDAVSRASSGTLEELDRWGEEEEEQGTPSELSLSLLARTRSSSAEPCEGDLPRVVLDYL